MGRGAARRRGWPAWRNPSCWISPSVSLAHALGLSPRDVGARLEYHHHHDWGSDPFTRGGYTYVKVGGVGAHRTLAEPVAGTLYFAGEATCGEGLNATMEGAVRSGRRAADELLAGSRK